jgi:transposase
LITVARRRGGQPENQNARTHGVYSLFSSIENTSFFIAIRNLQREAEFPSLPLQQALALAAEQRDRLDARIDETIDPGTIIALLELRFKLSGSIDHILRRIAEVSRPYHDLLHEAQDPLAFIKSLFINRAINRDADSFIPTGEEPASQHLEPGGLPAEDRSGLDYSFSPTSTKSTINSPGLPPEPPPVSAFAPFSLTGSQWAVLAPLLPPDPDLDHMHGEPPSLIAANRWKFADSVPGPLAAFSALEEYRRLTPAAIRDERLKPKSCGRPPVDHRPMLDAIFWKLSHARGWSELPPISPPWRSCQRLYRRLFNSGRLYTLLLALYDHLRSSSQIDPASLVEQGRLTLDFRDRVILAPGAPGTWETRTSLLLLQLAHRAHASSLNSRTRRGPRG